MKPVHATAPLPKHARTFLAGFLALLTAGLLALPAEAGKTRPRGRPRTSPISVLERSAPASIEDLRALQRQVKAVLKKVMPATVGLQVGGASGSGVIIDKEGHVLTAAHVSGPADRDVLIILPDGRRLKGKTLGANRRIDSGLIKITDKGDFKGELPFVEMGRSADLKKGQWCIATGHPGGFRPGRTPVVRLGRVQDFNDHLIRTDCTLVGGDSGGPLFDLQGRVIGIHSRIGGPITSNIHVPIDTYRDTWERLVAKEVWGGFLGFGDRANLPYMGVEGDLDSKEARITRVVPGSPAEKAGLKADDVILKFDGHKLEGYADLAPQIRRKKIGDKVSLEVLRGEETLKLDIVLGKRGNGP